jgi:GPH family glycoside/pentoside/hexuronide:cation symporter
LKKDIKFGQLSIFDIFAYNSGISLEIVTMSTYSLLAMPIYCMALGVSPALVGVVFFIPRILDAVIDPAIGYWSDNTRSPWGRRKPYLVLGGILTGLTYALTWCPPVWLGSTGLFVYFLILSILFYISYSIFIIPYYALGNEITFDPRTRARVMSWRNIVWGAVTLIAPWTYSMAFLPYFGTNEVQGVRIVGIIFGAFIIIAGLLPAIVCRENMEVQKQPKIHFIQALKDSMKNRPFLILAIARTGAQFGFGLISPMIMYIITYHTFNGDKSAAAHLWGYVGMSFGVAAMVAAPFTDYLIRKVGTKTTYFISLAMVLIGQLLWYFVVEPGKEYMTLIPYLFCGPGITGYFAVTSVWLADVCDYDEYLNGSRREGTYSAVFSLIFKVATAVAAGFSGFLITLAGINSQVNAVQSPQAIHNIRLLNSTVPVFFILISVVCGIMYPLNEKKMAEIRKAMNGLN